MFEGVAARRGVDLEGNGVAILRVGGKGNLDRALIVFTGFGIPCYAVWDGDQSNAQQRQANSRQNRALTRLTGLEEADFPPTTIGDRGAVFADKLETELETAVGDKFDEMLQRTADTVALPVRRDVLKTRYGCAAFMQCLDEENLRVPILDQLIDRLALTFA
jgi:predicted ATP-dependent endonuclease of OLD family